MPLRLVLFRMPPGRETAREESDGGESDSGESDSGESDSGESDSGESDSAPASALESPTVLINPEIEPIGESMVEDMEACLSLPGLAGMVPRHDRIRYRWTDTEGPDPRMRGTGLPRARGPARVRSLGRHPLPDADDGPLHPLLRERTRPLASGGGLSRVASAPG